MYFGSIPETQFYYTGDGTSGPKKSRPLASDWQVYPIRSTDANTFICNVLKSIKAAIKAMVDAYNIPRLSDITQHQKYWLKQYKSAYATPTYTVPLVDVSAALSEFWEFENTGSYYSGEQNDYIWSYGRGRTATSTYSYQWDDTDAFNPDNYIVLRRCLDKLTMVYMTMVAGNIKSVAANSANIGGYINNGESTVHQIVSASDTIPVVSGTLKTAYNVVYSTHNGNLYGVYGPPYSPGDVWFHEFTATANLGASTYTRDPWSVSGGVTTDWTTPMATAMAGAATIPWSMTSDTNPVIEIQSGAAYSGSAVYATVSLWLFLFRDLSTWLTDQT